MANSIGPLADTWYPGSHRLKCTVGGQGQGSAETAMSHARLKAEGFTHRDHQKSRYLHDHHRQREDHQHSELIDHEGGEHVQPCNRTTGINS